MSTPDFAKPFGRYFSNSHNLILEWYLPNETAQGFINPGLTLIGYGITPVISWLIIPLTIDITSINPNIIGLICTNLANELGHHLVGYGISHIYIYIYIYIFLAKNKGDMGVSINGGTPKWRVYKGKSIYKMDDNQGYPHFRKPPFNTPTRLWVQVYNMDMLIMMVTQPNGYVCRYASVIHLVWLYKQAYV